MRVVLLHLSTFRGISIDAEHWYGEMTYRPFDNGRWSSDDPRNFKQRVMKKMTQADADTLNNKDGWDYFQEGEETNRFDTIPLLLEAAKPMFREHFDATTDVLIAGRDLWDEWEFDKQRKVVDGPSRIVDQFEGLSLKEASICAQELGILKVMRGY